MHQHPHTHPLSPPAWHCGFAASSPALLPHLPEREAAHPRACPAHPGPCLQLPWLQTQPPCPAPRAPHPDRPIRKRLGAQWDGNLCANKGRDGGHAIAGRVGAAGGHLLAPCSWIWPACMTVCAAFALRVGNSSPRCLPQCMACRHAAAPVCPRRLTRPCSRPPGLRPRPPPPPR